MGPNRTVWQDGPSYAWWHRAEHNNSFTSLDMDATATLVRRCDQFNEFKLFRTVAARRDCNTLSDVGCAIGHFYRFFRKVSPALEYKGFDISNVAVEHGSQTYPDGNFTLFDGDLKSNPSVVSDIVFCRDVVVHQENPSQFLKDLYDITEKYLIVRLPTREQGATLYDISQSCQYLDGNWIPWLVFNTSELVDLVRSFDPPPARITIWRDPKVWVGRGQLFLPKEFYYPETGTADSALLIEKLGGGVNPPEVSVETHPQVAFVVRRPIWWRALKKLAYLLLRPSW